MSSSTTQTTLDYRREIYRQTNRILTANLLHLLPISLLFFPLTFSAHAAIQFHYSSLLDLIDDTASFQSFVSLKTLIIIVAFTFSVVLITVAGVASITYAANEAIHRKHITFSSTVKSLSDSYIPLLSTVIVGLIKLTLITLLFTLIFPIAITKANKALGLPFELFIFAISLINSIVFVIIITFFLATWGSGPAIAVLERKSGFEALRQSANQSAEFRSHSFPILYGSSYFIWMTLLSSVFTPIFSPTTISWVSIWNICFACLYSSLVVLQYVVANTVLYVQYKAACGGEMVQTAVEEEVSGEYVEVGGDDEEVKVLHEETKERFGGFSGILCGLLVLWAINFVLQTI